MLTTVKRKKEEKMVNCFMSLLNHFAINLIFNFFKVGFVGTGPHCVCLFSVQMLDINFFDSIS